LGAQDAVTHFMCWELWA